jgi:Variant SH3 domain/IQ calmodulin-binding motif
MDEVRIAIYKFSSINVDWPYKDSGQKLISLEIGEKIEVTKSTSGDWIQGKNLTSGVTGYFPKNYTISLVEWNRVNGAYTKLPLDSSKPPLETSLFSEDQAKNNSMTTSTGREKSSGLVRSEALHAAQAVSYEEPSLLSTPATVAINPESKDHRYEGDLENVGDILQIVPDVTRNTIFDKEGSQLQDSDINPDLRARASTERFSKSLSTHHLRLSSKKFSLNSFSLTFRPKFNDVVNETARLDREPSILSDSYLYSRSDRKLWLRYHVQKSAGTFFFDLQRTYDHLFYMRSDFVDVLMLHPEAWDYPEVEKSFVADRNTPFPPFHGWLYQIDDGAKVSDTISLFVGYKSRNIEPRTFESVALGILPDWCKIGSLSATHPDDTRGLEEAELLQAGLIEPDDVFVNTGKQSLSAGRAVAPRTLNSNIRFSQVCGSQGLSVFLQAKSDGSPAVSPKQVKQVAFQLGIGENYHFYWFALFVLQYPLPRGWETLVVDDIRFYIRLDGSGEPHIQAVHPLMHQFIDQLSDTISADKLWDLRGYVKYPCSSCPSDWSAVWCQQCTDYYCPKCMIEAHGHRKHICVPIPGCAYLSIEDSNAVKPFIPILNAGFCNRRRFLARNNQSDKTGPCQCHWLYFDKDAFEGALQLANVPGCNLARSNPPRLASDRPGFYYNFKDDIISETTDFIATRSHEQNAIIELQRIARGFITRQKLKKYKQAVVTVQKFKRMWDAQKNFGRSSTTTGVIRVWYSRHYANLENQKVDYNVGRVQSKWRQITAANSLEKQDNAAVFLQSLCRGIIARNILRRRTRACLVIQRNYRGYIYGVVPVQSRQRCATLIQSVYRGYRSRKSLKSYNQKILRISSFIRMILTRKALGKRISAAILIQSAWKRFQDSLMLKTVALAELELLESDRFSIISQTLRESAAVIIQNLFRMFSAKKLVCVLRAEKATFSRSSSTLVGQLVLSLAGIDSGVHPWWKYLPPPIRRRLEELKGPLHRVVSSISVSQKLADEIHFGKKLPYRVSVENDDFNTAEIFSLIMRQFLPTLNTDINESSKLNEISKWTSIEICHFVTKLGQSSRFFSTAQRSKPADFYSTSLNDMHVSVDSDNYWLSTLCLTEADSVRRVCSTAEVLVTIREILQQPKLKMESNLSFLGVDTAMAAEMIDTFKNDLLLNLPADWVAIAQRSCPADLVKKLMELNRTINLDEYRHKPSGKRGIGHFSRTSILRCAQYLGISLSRAPTVNIPKSHEILEIESLFELSKSNVYQEHVPFVLGVVVIHLVLRGLLLRLLRHRAAITIQVKFRYFRRNKSMVKLQKNAVKLQKYWRSLKSSISIYSQDKAARFIQNNYKLSRTWRRNRELIAAVITLQAAARSYIQRKWLRKLAENALKLQSVFRGHLTRVSLMPEEISLALHYDCHATDMSDVISRDIVLFASCASRLQEFRLKNVSYKKAKAKQSQMKADQMKAASAAALKVDSRSKPIVARASVFDPPYVSRVNFETDRTSKAVGSIFFQDCQNAIRTIDVSNKVDTTVVINVAVRRGLVALAAKRRGGDFSDVKHDELDINGAMDSMIPSNWLRWLESKELLPHFIFSKLIKPSYASSLRLVYLTHSALIYSIFARSNEGKPSFGNRFEEIFNLVSRVQTSPQAQAVVNCSCLISQYILNESLKGAELDIVVSKASSILAHILFEFFTLHDSDVGPFASVFLAASSAGSAARQYSSRMWMCTLEQFTQGNAVGGKYRNIKSRPEWKVLDEVFTRCMTETGYVKTSCMKDVSRFRSARFDDFLNEVLLSALSAEILSRCSLKNLESLEMFSKKRFKALSSAATGGRIGTPIKAGLDEVASDIEHQVLVSLCKRVLKGMDSSEGSNVGTIAILLTGVWEGISRTVERIASKFTNSFECSGNNSTVSFIPISTKYGAKNFQQIGTSYATPSKSYLLFLQSLPPRTLNYASKIQKVFRGFRLRRSMPMLVSFCRVAKLANWPLGEAEDDFSSVPYNEVEHGKYEREMESQPTQKLTTQKPVKAQSSKTREEAATMALLGISDFIHADHVACSSAFFLTVFHIWNTGRLSIFYQTISFFYQLCLSRFTILLAKTPHLKPLLETLGQTLKNSDARKLMLPETITKPKATSESFLDRQILISSEGKSKKMDSVVEPVATVSSDTNDYMKEYLIEMEGDDSQFRDIDANVVPWAVDAHSFTRRNPQDIFKFESLTAEWCLARLQPIWVGTKPSRFTVSRARLLSVMKSAELVPLYCSHEKTGNYFACLELLRETKIGSLNILNPLALVSRQPFWIESVFHLLCGYVGLCLKSKQLEKAASLIIQAISVSQIAFRDFKPVHKDTVIASIYESALGVVYASPVHSQIRSRAQEFFHEASERYLGLQHFKRYSKCCCRYSCILSQDGHIHEAEFFASQGLLKLETERPSSLSLVLTVNRAVFASTQKRFMEAEGHIRAAQAILRNLPTLGEEFMEGLDLTLWVARKLMAIFDPLNI